MTFDPNSIDIVSFDWGDTLIHGAGFDWETVDRRRFQRLADFLRKRGLNPAVDFVDTVTNEYRSRKRDTRTHDDWPENREIDEYEQMAGALSAVLPDWRMHVSLDEVMDNFFDFLRGGINFFVWCRPLLKTLKQRGYRIGILSQVSWPEAYCRQYFEREGLDQFIDAYSLSSSVGWHKPDFRHFSDFMTRIGASDPGRVLHVGDHPIRDVDGGNRFGFRTARINTLGVFSDEILQYAEPDIALTSAEQLLDILPDRRAGQRVE